MPESPNPTPHDAPNQSLPRYPALAVAPEKGEHVAVWSGADPEPPLAEMREIGSRRLRGTRDVRRLKVVDSRRVYLKLNAPSGRRCGGSDAHTSR